MTTPQEKPSLFITTWAENGCKFDDIPEDVKGKKGLEAGRASMEEGFPEITMKSAMKGGLPPWGQDHNGILHRITKTLQWIQAGGPAVYDEKLCEKLNGYPKGAILQSVNDPTILWFSVASNNMNDPDTTETPDNNWRKLSLEDIEDLRTRLKVVEDTKADLNGSCATDFHAHNMSAKKYDFSCQIEADDKANSYLTEKNGILKHYTDTAFRFYVGQDLDTSTPQLSIEQSYFTVNSPSARFEGGWLSSIVPTSIDNAPFMIRSADAQKVWLSYLENSSGDFVIENFQSGYLGEGKGAEILRIASESGDIHASANFQARNISGKRYDFNGQIDEADKANSYLTEKGGILRLYTDDVFRVYRNGLPDDKYLFSIEGGRNYFSSAEFKVDQVSMKASQWIQLYGATNVVNNPFMISANNKDNTLVVGLITHIDWVDLLDETIPQDQKTSSQQTKDIIFTLSDGLEDQKKQEVLRISYATGDIHASPGSFVNRHSDLAEYYQADRSDYEPGTLMCHGTASEVTLCKNSDQADDFFGVISTKPGYVMNANIKDDLNAVLIALNGKVPVKVKGIVKCGDKITIGQDGYGVVSKNKGDVIVARAKEDKGTEAVGLVSCYVRAYC